MLHGIPFIFLFNLRLLFRFFVRRQVVLNRAVPEEEAKAKKTAQGRAFNRT